MPSTVDVDKIITRAKAKANHEQLGTGPSFVGTTEGYDMVNEALGAFWDALVTAGGEELLRTSSTVSVTAGVQTVDAPSDAYKLLGLDLLNASNEFLNYLRKRGFERREDFRSTTGRPYWYLPLRGWSGETGSGAKIELLPIPDAAYRLKIHYVPESPSFSAGTDELTMPNKWWQWVVYEVAVRMKIKAEQDESSLVRERDRLLLQIMGSAAQTDHNEPSRVKRTRARRRHASRRVRYDYETYGD